MDLMGRLVRKCLLGGPDRSVQLQDLRVHFGGEGLEFELPTFCGMGGDRCFLSEDRQIRR